MLKTLKHEIDVKDGKIGDLKEGIGRRCPYCDMTFYDMERYGNHIRTCPKRPR